MDELCCSIKTLPDELQEVAAKQAITINPFNRISPGKVLAALGLDISEFSPAIPQRIAMVTTKYWGTNGVSLTVGFMESTPADLQSRILSHMNAWGEKANVKFVLSNTSPQVRITRSGNGYWSYLGTDILHIPANQPTMCLQNFTMQTAESEFHRVVRHETGHTLGCPHEHMRAELVARIDPAKAIAYFRQTQGWSAQMVMQQVLTPISETSIMGTTHAEEDSIMCYQLPGIITKDGIPIRGGIDITADDMDFMAKMYPKVSVPVNPNPPDPNPPTKPEGSKTRVTLLVGDGFASIEKTEQL